MIHKTLNEITLRDLGYLIAKRVKECATLSYRLALPSAVEDDRSVLADATGFANGAGGNLVFGVSQTEGAPMELVGIPATDFDDAVLRLRSILELWVAPRLSYELKRVPAGDDNHVVVLRVRRTSAAPHSVTLMERDGSTSGSTIEERIDSYVRRRVVEISSGRTRIPMLAPLAGARMALHLIPQLALESGPVVELARLYRSPGRFQPMWNRRDDSEDWDSMEMPDGLLTYHNYGWGGGPSTYAHISQTGIVEAVNVRFYSFERHGHWLISMHSVEESLIMSTKRYLGFQKDLGIKAPIHMFLSLMGVEGAAVPTREAMESGLRNIVSFAQSTILLDGGAFNDYSEAVDARFKAPLDTLYRLCGAAGAEHFDAKGRWKRFL